MKVTILRIFTALLVIGAAPAVQSSATTRAMDKVLDAQMAMRAHVDTFDRLMGVDGSANLAARLEDDFAGLVSNDVPAGISADAWHARLVTLADVDTSIVTQALSGSPLSLQSARGLTERLIPSRADGLLQEVAVYVPPTAGNDPSLVILLHGQPQTESEILVTPYFRSLADSTGTIVVAPYGRGNYDFAQPAADDMYDIEAMAVAAFHVSPHRVYLVGYSMGGFTVFKVGPMHAERWTAVMCISGAILNSETNEVRWRFRDTPMYVVTGKLDQSIPAVYGEETAAYLTGVGLQTEFDEEPNGTHYLMTLMPSLSTAWHNMLSGAVKNAPKITAGGAPIAAPPQVNDSMRP